MPRPSKLVPRSLKGEFRERGGSPPQTAMQYCVRGAGSQAPNPRSNQGDRQHFRLTYSCPRESPRPDFPTSGRGTLKPPTIVIPGEAKDLQLPVWGGRPRPPPCECTAQTLAQDPVELIFVADGVQPFVRYRPALEVSGKFLRTPGTAVKQHHSGRNCRNRPRRCYRIFAA